MRDAKKLKRLNIGSGDIPTLGWVNYDNSLTVRLAKWPMIVKLMNRFGLLSSKQQRFMAVVRQEGILYADAVTRIPEADKSAEVLYTCHMLEHLDRLEARRFLSEARRVLTSGGIIRIAVPDLRFLVHNYLRDGSADVLVETLFMARPKTIGLIDRIKYMLVGERNHLWMYDGESLCSLLADMGFQNPQILQPGKTTIADPGQLDLFERAEESVYVEAINP